MGAIVDNSASNSSINIWETPRTKTSRPVFPFCTSRKCNGKGAAEKSGGVIKDVKKTATNCPDCQYALWWGPINER